MDLTSCNGCGIVLDKNKLKFDNGWMESAQCYSRDAVWIGNEFVGFAKCPVCKTNIIKDE